MWCNSQGLYGKELVAVDGSKIRANCSRKNIHGQNLTEKELASVEKKINDYMNALEENDAVETVEAKLSSEIIHEILTRLNEKKNTLQSWLKQIEANGGNEISTVDSDAHIMHQSGDGRNLDACYNVQAVVDEKHKLIVDFAVSTCPDDYGHLSIMTESAKEIMGVAKLSALADKGYYSGEDIAECEKAGTTCFVPQLENGRCAPDPQYNHENFKYIQETDTYICPQGNILISRKPRKRQDGKWNRAYTNATACGSCPNREHCTRDKRGRQIIRNPYQETLDIIDERMKTDEARRIFRERKKIVEHPFGTTKHIWGYRQFLCRGQGKITAEQTLVFLAYNFRRVFNICKENRKNLVEMMG